MKIYSRKMNPIIQELDCKKKDRLKMSIELLDALLSVDPNDKPALLARGSIYLRLKNAKLASSDFSRVLNIDPHNLRAYHLRGLSKEMEGKFSQALKDFNRAIDIDPNFKIAYDSRDIVLTRMGRYT